MCVGEMVESWCSFFLFFFFKQKTAYEMRISDWSSDVCSSDLCKKDDACDIVGLERHLELVEVSPLFLAVAAIAGDDNAGPCKAGEDFGNADCSFGQFTADRFGEHPDAGLTGGIRRHVGHNPDGVDRTDVDHMPQVPLHHRRQNRSEEH